MYNSVHVEIGGQRVWAKCMYTIIDVERGKG